MKSLPDKLLNSKIKKLFDFRNCIGHQKAFDDLEIETFIKKYCFYNKLRLVYQKHN